MKINAHQPSASDSNQIMRILFGKGMVYKDYISSLNDTMKACFCYRHKLF